MKVFFKAYLASLLAGFTFIFLILLSFLFMPKEEKIVVRKNSILHLDLNTQIVERASDDPFEDFNFSSFSTDSKIGLNHLTQAIYAAKEDDKIIGIMMDFNGMSAGMSAIKEIRDALVDFKESEKFIWSYSDVYTQGAYYLASVSDSVFFNPSGYMDWRGLASAQPYMKNMFEKIGMKPVVVRGSNNRFKSAVEPFISSEMSDANREQLETILTDIWGLVLSEVGTSRSMSPDSVQAIANGMKALMPSKALAYGMVDELIHRTDIDEKLKVKTEAKSTKRIPTITPSKYVKSLSKSKSKDRIAVIYAEGDIIMGDGGPESISPEPFVKAVKKAAEKEEVKAIVLRVNSPGGSALASDVIYNELVKAKGDKPLIVSMGDLAASGGYFLSCPADKIIAQPTTITGSIGVFMMFFTFQELLEEKMGVNFHTVKTGQMADLGNPVRDLTDAEYKVFQNSVDETYGQFIQRIMVGRNLDSLYIDSIGQGRIWSGKRALELGLVDELGGLNRAIEIAAEEAGIKEDYKLYELPYFDNSLDRLMKSLNKTSIKEQVLEEELGEYYKTYKLIQEIKGRNGMMARLPVDITIE